MSGSFVCNALRCRPAESHVSVRILVVICTTFSGSGSSIYNARCFAFRGPWKQIPERRGEKRTHGLQTTMDFHGGLMAGARRPRNTHVKADTSRGMLGVGRGSRRVVLMRFVPGSWVPTRM